MHELSLAEYGARLRAGVFTAEATVHAALDRIADENPELGAFTFVDAAGAIAAARGVDLHLEARTDLGPLMGVPIALKDLYAATGLPMTAGSRVDIADRTPPEGTIVRALKRAGAIILGKTQTTEFAFGTYNPTHPTPRNPCDSTTHRMPGGSSSGSAVAVAAGLCAVAFGTDTGGSVRQPAALCGIAGFKSTAGRLPMDGVFPLSPTFDSAGWFAHRAADLALVWEVLSGEARACARPIDTLVLGWPDAHFFDGLEPDVARTIDLARRRIAAAGARIVPVTLPPLTDLDAAFGVFLSAELVAWLGRERVTENLSRMDPVVAARIAPGLTLCADAFIDMRTRFAALARAARDAMSGVDAVLTPASPRIAAPVDGYSSAEAAAAWSRETLRFTRPGNLFGLCGASLPIGHLTGSLPVGLQLLAPGGADAQLLSIAQTIERVVGGRSVTLRDEKRAMREQLLARRDALEPAVRAHSSRAIAAHVASMDAFRKARVVLLDAAVSQRVGRDAARAKCNRGRQDRGGAARRSVGENAASVPDCGSRCRHRSGLSRHSRAARSLRSRCPRYDRLGTRSGRGVRCGRTASRATAAATTTACCRCSRRMRRASPALRNATRRCSTRGAARRSTSIAS